MKILLISDLLPTRDNFNGPSAINYHIMKAFGFSHDTYIFSTNANRAPLSLVDDLKNEYGNHLRISHRNVYQKLITSRKTGRFFSPLFDRNLSYLSRYTLSHTDMHWISQINPDLILIYPDHLIRVAEQLSSYRTMVIGPDCNPLFCLRALQDNYVYDHHEECKIMAQYKCQVYSNKMMSRIAGSIGVVGMRDHLLYEAITHSGRSYFIPHPHYTLADKEHLLEHDKINVVFSGKCDIYTSTDANQMIDVLCKAIEPLDDFKFTFMGKSWSPLAERLQKVADVQVVGWVDIYADEILKHDVQIFPIGVGCGTKGKVLDALSYGLLCVGSRCAFENIAVKDSESCICYQDATDIMDILMSIKANRQKYIEMAGRGKSLVRKYHNPGLVAQTILNVAINKKYNVDSKIYSHFIY